MIFDLAHEAVFSDKQVWAIQGLPLEVVGIARKHANVSHLVGEGMFVPNVATVLAGLYYNTESSLWEKRDHDSSLDL